MKISTNQDNLVTPSILYKYRYFDDDGYHLKLIQNADLWFTSANNFNDPFDCSLHFNYADSPPGIRRKWAMDYIKKTMPHLSRVNRRAIVNARLKEIKTHKYIEWCKNQWLQRNYNNFGMCCLTPFRDNLLMWAHYSLNHEGFCIGLDVEKLKTLRENLALEKTIIDLQKISYNDSMPEIFFYHACLDGNWFDVINTLICTKSDEWKYEQEYRLILYNTTNTSINIGNDIIQEIILGCCISDTNKKRLINIIKEVGLNSRIYQAEKDETKFSLKFNLIMN